MTFVSIAMVSGFIVVNASQATGPAPQEPTPAQIHVGHVMEAINGTPGGVGLLTILEEEAEIAARHAELAVGDLTNLETIQRHVRHVRHAVDPSTEEGGPGKGYGVTKAADGVQTHIQLAARSKGATDNIERHAVHVAASAANVARWARIIVAESEKVVAAETAEEAAPSAERIAELTRHILEGTDANEDGRVSWEAGEGGIAQAKQHMGIMTSSS